MADTREQMAVDALKRVGKGALWIGIAGGISLLLRFAMLPGLYMVQGWVPLIVRLIGEAIMIGGLLALAEGPETWRIRELAIFSGLGTLPRPLLWAINMVLPFLHLDWGFAGFPFTMATLVDAGSFAAIVYLIERVETASGGQKQTPPAMAGYGAAGLLALSAILDLVGVMPATIPLLPLASAAVGIALFFQVKQLTDRLGRGPGQPIQRQTL
jgi:hypothetical protein